MLRENALVSAPRFNLVISLAGEVIRFTDVKDFPLAFWLLSIICVAYYVTIFPFIGLGL